MAQLMALFLLGTLHCSSGIVITVDRTTLDPIEIERCRSSIAAVPQLNLTRHHTSRPHYIVPGVAESTIERPDLLERSPTSSEATSKKSYLSSTPLHEKPKVATLPEEPGLISSAGNPLISVLTPLLTTPSTVLLTSPSSIEPLTPTWYITSPPPTPLTVHTSTESAVSVNIQYLDYTTKPYEPNKPTLLTRQTDKENLPTHLALEKPKQLEKRLSTKPTFLSKLSSQTSTDPPTQPAHLITNATERATNHASPLPLIHITATTQPAFLYSTIPAARGHRSVKPAAVRPALQEMEKELSDLLREQIALLLTDDIAETLYMSYRARLQFANHEMVDKLLQQESLTPSYLPGECPMRYYERRNNLLKRLVGLLLLALPQSLQELEEAAWDDDLENNFFRPGEKNILDVPECRECYTKDSLGNCREIFFCKAGSSADVRTGLSPEDLKRLLALG
ncbi:mucin-3A isoform X2 [Penaeus vannamei]